MLTQEVFDPSLFSDVQTCRLDINYNLPQLLLVLSFQNRTISIQYIYGFSWYNTHSLTLLYVNMTSYLVNFSPRNLFHTLPAYFCL